MTEQQWMTSSDPAPMFNLLDKGCSERKLRLFACACCRNIWHLLSEEQRAAVESAERRADGLIPAEEMYARAGIHPVFGLRNYGLGQTDPASKAVLEAASPGAWLGARNARAFVVDALRAAAGAPGRASEWQRQSDLLRCIVGNPFRSVSVNPAWLAWNDRTVVRLAQAIYAERAFDRLPVLADALEEAGCDDVGILAHLRGPGLHARGCFVLDLLLQKGSAEQGWF